MEVLTPSDIALAVTSGILIAACIMGAARFAIASFQRGDVGMAFAYGAFSIVIGGGFILAGLETIAW